MLAIQDHAGTVYPADRCTWNYPEVIPGGTPTSNQRRITDNNARTTGYYLSDVRYYPGDDNDGNRLFGRPFDNLADASDANAVVGGVVILGLIDAYRQFQPLSNPF